MIAGTRYHPWNLVVVGVVALLLAWYGWRIVRAQFRRGGGRAPMGDLEYRAAEPGRQDAGPGTDDGACRGHLPRHRGSP